MLRVIFKSCLALSFFLFTILGYALADDTSDFQQVLEKFLPVSKSYLEAKDKKDEDVKSFQKVVEDMKGFYTKYPDSIYADDAEMLIISALFIEAIKDKNKDSAKEIITQMQSFLDRHPDLHLEDYTIEKCKRMMSIPVSSAVLSVPYSYTPVFMQGILGCQFEDNELVIVSYTALKDKMDYSKDKYGLLGEEIYVKLYQAYEKLGKLEEAKKIAREAIDRLKDNRNLRHYMKRKLNEGTQEECVETKKEKDPIYGLGV